MRQMTIRILSLSLALSLLGCGGNNAEVLDGGSSVDMTGAAPAPTNFAGINKEILQPTCTFSTCHSTTGARTSNKLNLQDDPTGAGVIAFAALVNQPAVNAKAAAAGLLRVKPCDATDSFLMTKLTLAHDLDPDTDYGARMPSGSPALPAADVQAIQDWISRGALQDEPATVSGSTCAVAVDGGI
jgi:hypothetical protein